MSAFGCKADLKRASIAAGFDGLESGLEQNTVLGIRASLILTDALNHNELGCGTQGIDPRILGYAKGLGQLLSV